jgi:HSP20 family protein
VSELEVQAPPKPPRGPTRRQRALNALIFLLVAAVCVQAVVMWELNARLDKTVAELDSVKQMASNADWKVIPRPENAADPNDSWTPSNDPQAQQGQSGLIDPFWQFDPQGWDPFAEIERMRQEMDRLMGRAQAQTSVAPQVGGVSRMFGGVPGASIEDMGDSYVVRASLPGVDASDVSVRIENQVLTITVNHNRRDDKQGGQGFRQQRASRSFKQLVTLPQAVDGAAMKSSFKDDVLTITIPKAGRASQGTNSDPSQSVRGR